VVRVAIPGGVWHAGAQPGCGPLRELTLRRLSGDDEAYLLDAGVGSGPGTRATALLIRCLGDGDGLGDMTQVVRTLTVGDREALLLHLRRISIGETLDCVLPCPEVSCGERMQLELRVADLLLPAYDDVQPVYSLTVAVDDARCEVAFRLPTADDLDEVARTAREDAGRAADLLLARCVSSATRAGAACDVGALGPALRAVIAAEMAQRDPQAEIELDLTCPECGHEFSVVFDTAAYLMQELDSRAAQLMHDVHTLALHYHWSEHDILQLPRERRARYLQLVADSSAVRIGER